MLRPDRRVGVSTPLLSAGLSSSCTNIKSTCVLSSTKKLTDRRVMA